MGKFMKMPRTVIMLLVASCFISNPAGAEGPVETVVTGCQKELKGFCKDVTPGEGRMLACLYAHNDKLSGQCEYALFDAAVQLERAIATLTYVANECSDDIIKNCLSVEAGEGRILACLEENQAKVSERCKQAIEDVGFK
jgi:hypothetical protein